MEQKIEMEELPPETRIPAPLSLLMHLQGLGREFRDDWTCPKAGPVVQVNADLHEELLAFFNTFDVLLPMMMAEQAVQEDSFPGSDDLAMPRPILAATRDLLVRYLDDVVRGSDGDAVGRFHYAYEKALQKKIAHARREKSDDLFLPAVFKGDHSGEFTRVQIPDESLPREDRTPGYCQYCGKQIVTQENDLHRGCCYDCGARLGLDGGDHPENYNPLVDEHGNDELSPAICEYCGALVRDGQTLTCPACGRDFYQLAAD